MSAQTNPATVEYDDENNHPTAGTWAAATDTSNVRGVIIESPAITHTPTTSPDENITIGVYHGAADGKPVIQIDGDGDIRINVNDGTIWDSGISSGEWDLIHNAAKDHVRTLRREAKIHVGSAREDLFAHIAQLEAALEKLA